MKKLFVLVFGLLSFCFATAAINLNNASQEELESLKGIGSVKARAIIEYRKQNGSFKSADEIKNVKGIGDKTFEAIKDEVTVQGQGTRTTSNRKEPEKKIGAADSANVEPTAKSASKKATRSLSSKTRGTEAKKPE